jgi:hypothetical protein
LCPPPSGKHALIHCLSKQKQLRAFYTSSTASWFKAASRNSPMIGIFGAPEKSRDWGCAWRQAARLSRAARSCQRAVAAQPRFELCAPAEMTASYPPRVVHSRALSRPRGSATFDRACRQPRSKALPCARIDQGDFPARLLAGGIIGVPREATNRYVETNVTAVHDGEK